MEKSLRRLLHKYPSLGVSFLELRTLEKTETRIEVRNGETFSGRVLHSKGIAIRALTKGKMGFSFIEGMERATLPAALQKATANAHLSLDKDVCRIPALVKPIEDYLPLKVEIDPRNISLEQKKERILALERKTGKFSPYITQTNFRYTDCVVKETLVNSLGTHIEYSCARCYMSCTLVAENKYSRQLAINHWGRLGGFEVVLDVENLGIDTAVALSKCLQGGNSPRGTFVAILDPRIMGLIIHEGVGHLCEADFVLKGESLLQGKLGEKIAPPYVTVYDDPTLDGSYGSYPYDSEGTPGRRTILIEKGILKGYMHTLSTACQLNTLPTGNGRSNSFRLPPSPRMSNTILEPGSHSLGEMVAKVKEGIIITGVLGNVSVFPKRGTFWLDAQGGAFIRRGEIAEPFGNITISGNIMDLLRSIALVGDRLSIDLAGPCSKYGQEVFVDAGAPYVMVEGLMAIPYNS